MYWHYCQGKTYFHPNDPVLEAPGKVMQTPLLFAPQGPPEYVTRKIAVIPCNLLTLLQPHHMLFSTAPNISYRLEDYMFN